jgi:hypothetical protein
LLPPWFGREQIGLKTKARRKDFFAAGFLVPYQGQQGSRT